MIFLGRNSSNAGALLILYFFTHVQERNQIYFSNKRVLSVDFACGLQSTGFSSLKLWRFNIHTTRTPL